MDKVFSNYSRNNNDKNKALEKIKEERAKRQKTEVEAKGIKSIQNWWRKILNREKLMSTIYADLEKKFKDIETLVVYLAKTSNKKFTIPLNIHIQMIMNMNLYYNYSVKKFMQRKPYFTKYLKKDITMQTKLKNSLTLFEKLLNFSTGAIENTESTENIYYYTIANESIIDKSKKQIKAYSIISLKSLLRMSIITLDLTNSIPEIYQINTVNKTLGFLHLAIDLNGPLKYNFSETEKRACLAPLYNIIISLSNEVESKRRTVIRTQLKKPIIQVFATVLQKAISFRKEKHPR